MARNVFVQMSKLTNVKGRINYISSAAKQENLYAVCETCDRSLWTKLAKENQEDFKKRGNGGKCIEARELIIALPEKFTSYNPDELLREYTECFKKTYGVECISALHHNKAKTNYHIHLIFSERKVLDEPIKKVATRNMFYNEKGRHVRTKKEILGPDGNVRKGCKIIKKGSVYEEKYFDRKISGFKDKQFIADVKKMYADKMNERMSDAGYKMGVFNRNGPYLATKKVGKNNPKAKYIRENNAAKMKWNTAVSKALMYEIPVAVLIAVKKSEIHKQFSEVRIEDKGTALDMMTKIISRAVLTLGRFVTKVLKYHLKQDIKPDGDMFNKLLSESRMIKGVKRTLER